MVQEEKSQLLQDFDDLSHDDTKYSILMIANVVSPINLKSVAEIMNKSESTLHPHFKYLKDNNFLTLDVEATENKRGKYYKLKDEIKEYIEERLQQAIENFEQNYQNIDEMDIENINEKAKKEIQELGKRKDTIFSVLNLHHNLQQILFYKTIDYAQNLKDTEIDITKEPTLYGSLNQISGSFPIFNFKHGIQFSNLLVDFIREIKELEDNIKDEMKELKIDPSKVSQQYFSVFSAPMPSENMEEGLE